MLDGHGEPVPIGVAGELYIGGAGVARGYLNRPELTAERFVADPFCGRTRRADVPDGRPWPVACGRDDRVPGPQRLPGEDPGLPDRAGRDRGAALRARRACARRWCWRGRTAPGTSGWWPTMWASEGAGAEALRAHLAASLPDYMVPAAYVRLEALPLTPNGKLDRKALPAPEGTAYAARGYEAPQGEVEETLARIWAEVLEGGAGRPARQLLRARRPFAPGGAAGVAAAAGAGRGGAAARSCSRRPMLADFAASLAAGAAPDDAAAGSRRWQRGAAPLPLSFAQQRLWFLEQLGGAGAAYHIPVGLRLKGRLDREALGRALQTALWRGTRRCARRLRAVDGQPVQRIAAADSGFALTEHDLRGIADAEAELERAGGGGSGGAVRSGARAADPRAPGAAGRRRACAAGDDAPHRLGRLVDGGADQGAERAVWRFFARAGATRCRRWRCSTRIMRRGSGGGWRATCCSAQAAYWKTALAGAPALLELPRIMRGRRSRAMPGRSMRGAAWRGADAGAEGAEPAHGMTLYMTLLAGWAALLSRLAGRMRW